MDLRGYKNRISIKPSLNMLLEDRIHKNRFWFSTIKDQEALPFCRLNLRGREALLPGVREHVRYLGKDPKDVHCSW